MSSSDRMSISYLCASSEPPADDAMTMDTLRKMQAEFNRNKRRSVREKSVVTTILKDRDNSDPSDDEECEPRKAAYVYDAVDPITGHVLVNGKWMPYVTLRWNCRELRDKDKLISSVKALMKVPITPEQDAKERTPVNTICSIVPCHVIPRLDDGTAAGKYVRVVYRLKGRNIRGMTTLEVLSKGYVSKPQERLKLKEFVTAEFEKIAKAGRNQAQLISIMGLTVQHDDFMPVKTGYKFKHFNFGKIMQCVDTDLETEIAQFLANVSKADDLIPPRPAPESDVMNRTSALLLYWLLLRCWQSSAQRRRMLPRRLQTPVLLARSQLSRLRMPKASPKKLRAGRNARPRKCWSSRRRCCCRTTRTLL